MQQALSLLLDIENFNFGYHKVGMQGVKLALHDHRSVPIISHQVNFIAQQDDFFTFPHSSKANCTRSKTYSNSEKYNHCWSCSPPAAEYALAAECQF